MTDANDDRITRCGRRGFLAGLSGGTVTGVAGCLTAMPSLGEQVRFGRVDEPPGFEPIYRKWVPDERAGSSGDWTPSVLYTTPGRTGADVVGRPYTLGRSVVQASMDYIGVDFETMAYVGQTSEVAFAVGTVDRDAVDETITRTGYEPADRIRDLEVYARSDTDRTLAVGEDVLLSSSGDRARTLIERVYDASRGRTASAYESRRDFRTFVDHVRASPFVHVFGGSISDGQAGELPDSVYSTMEFRFDENHVYSVNRALYEDEASVDRRTIERHIHENDRARRAHNVDIRVEGRIAGWVIQMTHSEYNDSASGPAGFVQPHITWGVEDDGDEITLVHEAGDPIDADLLEVLVRRSADRQPTDRQFSDEYDSVSSGDRLTIDASEFGQQETLTIVGSVPDSPNGWAELHYDRD